MMNNDTKHIFILIAGTVDPVCTSPGDGRRAQNHRDSRDYWHDYPQLVNGLKRLCSERSDLALFYTHGWSGDNTSLNRKLAGAWLADRLCGGNGKKACYADYLNKKVAFHLIGHSHGGNVLNEFTARAAAASEWPSLWEIKSITYLSTPFFKHQHILDPTRLSKDCALINVTNDFDLTQRVIADFSIYDLISVCKLPYRNTPGLKEHLDYIKNSPLPEYLPDIWTAFARKKTIQCLFHPDNIRLDPQEGQRLFQEMINVLGHIEAALCEVNPFIRQLHTNLSYPSDPELLQLSSGQMHHLINDELYEQIRKTTRLLLRYTIHIRKTVMAYHNRKDYRLLPLLDEISPELHEVIKFFAIDNQTTSGPVADLLYQLITHQMETFDNTRTSPRHQLDYEFSERLHHVDVTAEDPYFSRDHLIRFNQLTKQLIQAEADYEERPTQKNMLKVLICLLASQHEIMPLKQHLKQTIMQITRRIGPHHHSLRRFIARILTCRKYTKSLRQLATQLLPVLNTYHQLLTECDIRLLKPLETQKKHITGQLKPGSLGYFTIYSHSVSRQQLWPDIEQLLIPLLPTPKPQITEHKMQDTV